MKALLAISHLALASCAKPAPADVSATPPVVTVARPVAATTANAPTTARASGDAGDPWNSARTAAVPPATTARKRTPPGEYVAGPGQPRILEGAFTVQGGLAHEVVQNVLRKYWMAVIPCYESGLKRNPKLNGPVRVRIEAQPSGVVTTTSDSQPDDEELDDADTVACIVGAFRDVDFPPADGGGPVIVRYRLLLLLPPP